MEGKDFLEKMNNYGCDTVTAMSRMLDDVEFYNECVMSFLEDESFEALGKCLKENNLNDAFDCAHTIKGVAGNLGITPIYDCVCLIVEPLRAGKTDSVEENYLKLMDLFNKLKQTIQ